MRLLEQFRTSLFFLRKDFARTKTQTKPKPINVFSLRSFYVQKIVAFVVFCSFVVLLVGFGLVCAFLRAKNKLVWNCPNNFIYHTTDVLNIYILQSLHRQLVGFHSFNLFLKTCNDEEYLSSSGNSDHVLVPKFDTVSFPNNAVLMFLKARWVPLLKM